MQAGRYGLPAIIISVFLLLGILAGGASAGPIPDDLAVRCVVGEAADQGETGMYALASGLLNRGTTDGVFGCRAKHIDHEPAWVWEQARKAWEKAKVEPLHTGDHWENIKAFGVPKWAKNMPVVYAFKNHVFYASKGKPTHDRQTNEEGNFESDGLPGVENFPSEEKSSQE